MDDPPPLAGRWTLRRRLVDHKAGIFGSAHGTLTIVGEQDAMIWRETAQLSWAGRILPVTRELRLIVRDGRWWTTFTDHRPFHPWQLDHELVHPCADDVYRGRMHMTDDVLRVLWDVTGPTKQQRIITTHRRQPGS